MNDFTDAVGKIEDVILEALSDLEKDTVSFLVATWKYVSNHIDEMAIQAIKDGVAAAEVSGITTGDGKYEFAFSNITSAVGKDLVADAMAIFNIGIEAAVQQQKASEAVRNAVSN